MTAKIYKRPYPHSGGFRHGWFYDDVYRANYRVISGKKGKRMTTDQVVGYLKQQFGVDHKPKDTNWDARTMSLDVKSGNQVIVLAFRDSAPDYSIICHEAIHCANIVMAGRGYVIDPDNDEPYAYYVESLVKRIALCLGMK